MPENTPSSKDNTPRLRFSKSKRALVTSVLRARVDNSRPKSPEELAHVLGRVCEQTLQVPQSTRRKPNPWWTRTLTELRADLIKTRRRLMRTNKATNGCAPTWAIEEYRSAYQKLRFEIQASKGRLYGRLCDALDTNPWGKAYRMAMTGLKPRKPTVIPDNIDDVVAELFPKHDPIRFLKKANPDETKPFSEEELFWGASRLRRGKCSGPDGIPAEVIQILVEERPQVVLDILNDLLRHGVFPSTWKTAELRLIPKEGSTTRLPKYRPICLLNTLGKLFEALIANRLTLEMSRKRGALQNQHAYQRQKSTMTAVDAVLNFCDKTVKRGQGWTPAIILLDVANAFNSASWKHIIDKMEHLELPDQLTDIIKSYLTDRTITSGPKTYNMTSGVPQGSVLGPILWNILFDGVLNLELPLACQIVGYADDIALLIGADKDSEMKSRTMRAMTKVNNWMKDNDLEIATAKTKALIARGRRSAISRNITLTIGDTVVAPTDAIKYLGVWLDQNLNFQTHAQKTRDATQKAINCLGAILSRPSIRMAKRRIIATVAESKLLYGAEVWFDRMPGMGKRILESAQREAALRIIGGYHSVSTEAALILSGMVPIEIAARSRRMKFKTGIELSKTERVQEWARRWQQYPEAKWTKRLIPDIRPWIQRTHGEVTHEMTQFLTGHGQFGDYLKRMNKQPHDRCTSCTERSSARHVLFNCEKWSNLRQGNWTEADLIHHMIKDAATWNRVATAMSAMLKNQVK